VTIRGGRHLGHALARERGGVDCVAARGRGLAGHASSRGGRVRGAVLTMGLVVWASKPPNATDGEFC
jgi:hypothetical protein